MLWVREHAVQPAGRREIPIGRYGTSNVGRAKSVYRMGLAHRYGRRMQTISGIHYNWSLPDVVERASYFALIRNFRRHAWLLLYLFGASPAVCSSFVAGRAHELQPLADGHAVPAARTSLRMGRLGYQSDAQASLAVSYNSLDELRRVAARRADPALPAVRGDRHRDGRRLPASSRTSLLQIENEFYGTIRPKRVIRPGERPLHALRERGVEYVEVRLMDLDPFDAGRHQRRDHALPRRVPAALPARATARPTRRRRSPPIARNQQRVAARGREPGLRLSAARTR